MTKQLTFEFLARMDREEADRRQVEAERMRRLNAASHLKWCMEEYPPENEEWDVMLMGIRLARFVSNLECEPCNLGCYNHCPHCLGMHWSDRYKQYTPIKVCLKDFFAKCKEWGLKEFIIKH